jgi:ATP-binding cassette subfamily C protein
MRLLITFLRAYPLQSALTLTALLFAGVVEGFGLSLLLPLLGLAVRQDGIIPGAEATNPSSHLEQIVSQAFDALGITPTVGLLLIIIVATMLLKALLMLVASKRVGYTVAEVVTDLRQKVIHALFAARWEFFIRQPVGTLTNSMASETGRASKSYISGIKMLSSSIQTVVYGVIVILLSWTATLVAIAAGIIILVILKGFINKSRRAGKRQTKLAQSMIAVMTETLMMIKPLKTMGREQLADAVLGNTTEELGKAIKEKVYAGTALSAFQKPVTIAVLAVGIYYALVILKLPMVTMLVVVYIFKKFMDGLQRAQKDYQELVVAESAYWSMLDKVEAATKCEEQALGTRKVMLTRSIRLAHVSFAYNNDRWIIKNADFDFPAGSFTAIVGPSGAGKTTVVDLVTGLLRPDEGEVFIDDTPLCEIDLKHWRRMIGYVPQETLLLHDTVFANVTLGDRGFTDQDVEHALRAAGAWDFVKDLPEGMDTIAGERGHKLSGGQRQRVAIARALIFKPKVLILDEATTALDPNTEKAICSTLRKLRGELTIIAISHQPAVLEVADKAYRLENGIVLPVEDSSKADLQFEEIQAGSNEEPQRASVSGTIK